MWTIKEHLDEPFNVMDDAYIPVIKSLTREVVWREMG